jgi:MFS family permease
MSRAYALTLLAALYLAQGLPYGFFTQALPVLMREQGASLKLIGATSLLFLPWALKFLWAPLADRVGTPRQWLLPLQWGLTLGAGLLALGDYSSSLMPVFAALLLFNLAAAVQDVVTDGLAVRMLGPRERGLGNGIQVGAYRIGMILGGGALLWVFAKGGWALMFSGMSLLLLLMSLPALWLRESPSAQSTTPSPAQSAGEGWGGGVSTAGHSGGPSLLTAWLPRLRQPGMGTFIVLICAYKFGDTMAAALVGPFMKDSGWSTEGIALLKGTVGSTVSLAGAALGGWLSFRFGRRITLLAFGLLQSASLVLYGCAAAGLGGDAMMWAACIAEHLLGSMATVALFTLMMDASDPQHASTDYSLFACAIVVAQGLAMFSGGAFADAFGYLPLFALATLVSLAGCIALVTALDRKRGPQRLGLVWRP